MNKAWQTIIFKLCTDSWVTGNREVSGVEKSEAEDGKMKKSDHTKSFGEIDPIFPER